MAGTVSSTGNDNSNGILDPLVEQMRSVLHLGPRANDASQRRQRRFSDADRPSSAGVPVAAEPVAIRSRDGTRWLPAPDEQSLGTRQRRRSSTANDGNLDSSLTLEQHACSSAMCALSRVFETTELLELIISFLDTKDVICLRRTSRRWNSTILESPQLRLHFFTYGQWARPGSQYQLLPISVPGLTMELGDELHLGQWIIVTLTPEAARRICPDPQPTRRVRSRSIYEGLRGGLGPRDNSSRSWPAVRSTPIMSSTVQYEELLITQPPVLGMQAFIVYFGSQTDEEIAGEADSELVSDDLRACAKLSCDAGITLGFLAETAQSLLTSQKAGPSHAKEGRVVFKTIMSFCAPEQAPRKRTRNRTVTPIP